jgi:hypothetical protein
MDLTKESLEKRLIELKEANEKENTLFNEISETKQKLLQNILVRNGRILELEKLLKQLETEESK